MANGLNITVSKEDFTAKPTAEQMWMLFQATEKLNTQGCSWGKKNHLFQKTRVLWTIGAGIGVGIGVGVSFWKFICG